MAIEVFTITSNVTFTTATAAALTAAAMEKAGFSKGTDETDLEYLNRLVEEHFKAHIVSHHSATESRLVEKTAGDEARNNVTIRPRKDRQPVTQPAGTRN